MLFPIGYEGNLLVRRWPFVTVAIILICLVTFILTNSAIQGDSKDNHMVEVRTHILILHARFPELPITPKTQEMVDRFKRDNPDIFRQLSNPMRQSPVDLWEAQLLANPDWKMDELAAEMADLCKQWESAPVDSFLWKYAYHSERPAPWSYITSAFLHGGWLHLILNMWFLYLVGALLEDAWGHVLYTVFYLAAGAAAAFGYGLAHPNSAVNLVGASGAIAGLMGAFMVRFPTAKIRLAWIWMAFASGRMGVCVVPAWGYLAFWAASEAVLTVFNLQDGVAHWAHVSGFLFGMVVGGVLRLIPVEKVVNSEDPSKTWTPDQDILAAMDLLNQRQPEEARAVLEQHLATHPESVDAHEMMLKVHAWKGDQDGERVTLAALAALHLGQGNPEPALKYYEQFRQLNGVQFPANVWSWLVRYLERQEQWERAAGEYERLAAEYPNERIALDALMSAARLYLTKLNNGARAERLYRAVESSPIPHLDLELMVAEGLKKCVNSVRTAGA